MSEIARHPWLFNRYGSKRACLNMVATSPTMIFKNYFSKLVSLMARNLATKEFLIHIQLKRVCFDVLATSPPMIFHGWYFKASVRNGSPPENFEFILIKESLFGYACHLATNVFQGWFVKTVFRNGSQPCHQWFLRLICQNMCQKWLVTSPPMTF